MTFSSLKADRLIDWMTYISAMRVENFSLLNVSKLEIINDEYTCIFIILLYYWIWKSHLK